LLHHLDTCPLCHSPDSDVIRTERHSLPQDPFFDRYRERTITLRRCRSCTFAYVDELPTDPVFFEKIYMDYKPDFAFEMAHHGKKAIFADLRDALARHGYRGGKLLDVGCWVGHFLRSMKDRFEVQGVEYNRYAAEYGIASGIPIQIATFKDAALPEGSFDVVSLIDVLEHLPEPDLMLRKAAGLLKPGGAIVIKVPNYVAQIGKQNVLNRLGLSKAGMMENYVHINHFTRRSLGAHLRRIGFEVLEDGFTRAEVWDLDSNERPTRKLRHWARNVAATGITGLFSATSHLAGRETGFNLYVLARKCPIPTA
jgi:2-polyprenyl-3-methyl-5-hydroxy-6-metoxy-1,4-benzoquinol methylase